MASPGPPPDRHVHSEWSWDAAHGDMLATCRRAVEMGLPAIAFTEHADFTAWVAAGPPARTEGGGSAKEERRGGGRRRARWDWSSGRIAGRRWPVRVPARQAGSGDLDVTGYWEAIEACRAAHPGLRIESGVELGEPHLFPDRAAALLAHRPPDRVLGSLHCLEVEGELVDMSVPEVLAPACAAERFRRYLVETLELVRSPAPFTILTHLDYPKRFWPHAELRFDERDFEEEYRAVLRALARRGSVLEVNSSRAMPAPRAPCPGLLPLRWWREEGGEAVSFGSDAHRPEHLALGLPKAAALAEAAGFRPADDPLELWRRA
jgi:histidinol-phosphatase (PHP family)